MSAAIDRLEHPVRQVAPAQTMFSPAPVEVASRSDEAPAVAAAGHYQMQIGQNVSESERQLLTDLDARRVELEKRRENLERREQEVAAQESELVARLTELRTLTRTLQENRKQLNHRYEARMEQLANVYGSMAPSEAAPLIAKLDDTIALALLQRMPGKRMGQILSLMEQQRAIELTKMITERGQL
ncbi:MAG: hypothetical protein KDD44_00845 [Bdellovibrionales bacterium]|nr:hypothetical protein [Bdellovibrionales bacterium]